VHFHINPPQRASIQIGTASFLIGTGGGIAISPDGKAIVFAAASGSVSKLWVRFLDSVVARELSGTDGAQFPFWSPDSRYIGFSADGKLKRIDLSGGPPINIATVSNFRGGSWNDENTIIFSPDSTGGLQSVPASGGTPVSLTAVDPVNVETTHRWPQFIPRSRQFIFYVRSTNPGISGVYLSSLDRPNEKIQLIANPTTASYAPPRGGRPGYLFWLRQDTLTAQPFDAARAQLSGEPVPVPGADAVGSIAGFNLGSFSVSREGVILFSGVEGNRYELTWFDRAGNPLSATGPADRYDGLRLAPDGERAVVSLFDASGNHDIWRLDFARGLPSRLTFGGQGFAGVWSPDGQRLAFHGNNTTKLFEKSASGTGAEAVPFESKNEVYINDWSPDGHYWSYTESSPNTGYDLWLLPTSGDRKPVPYLNTPFSETHGQFSPDTKWLSYSSNESGRNEIYVQSIPPGTKWLISNGGGYPLWRRDGKEIFYRALDGRLMVVPVGAIAKGEFGTPVPLFRMVEPPRVFSYPYDVTKDGRILALAPSSGAAQVTPLTVLVNWDAALH
jgi:Tol biopolymer transport system component